MADKKYDLPAMPFYIGDWKKDPAVQILNREDKMIWLELIFLMWESEERGYLTVNKKPMTIEMIAVALNLDNQNASKRLTSFADIGLFSIRESDGAIYCRKIVNIVELSNKRKNAGKRGGNPNLVNQDLTKNEARGYPNAETETLNENEIIINKEKEEDIDYLEGGMGETLTQGLKLPESVQELMIRTFGRNPKEPEHELTEILIEKFGMEKIFKTYKAAVLAGFKNLGTLKESLDEEGSIKPRPKNEFQTKTEKRHRKSTRLNS